MTNLQFRASTATPQWQRRKTGPKGRWSELWPVYKTLRDRGFTIREAVDWLIRDGRVTESDRKKAEYGLPMVNSRRRREELGDAALKPKKRGKRSRKQVPRLTHLPRMGSRFQPV